MQTTVEKSQEFKELCKSLGLDYTEIPEVKSFEEACKILEVDSEKLPDVSMIPDEHQKSIIAHYKLMIIAKALNEGWKPDWKNWDEYKYYPWFESNSSGGGFSFDVNVRWLTPTYVGSRLCYRTRTIARYAGKQFIDLYNDLMVL